MGAVGDDVLGAAFLERRRRVAQGPRRIDDVVDEDAEAAGDVADDVHHFGFAGPFAALVDDRQRRVVEPLGQRPGADDPADVRRDDGDVPALEPGLDVRRHHRGGVEIVGRDVEEALDLAGVEIDRKDSIGASNGDQIGDELGGNGGPRAGLPVLSGIAEIGDDGGDPLGRGAAKRVDADQQFHQIVVGRIGGRLDDEDVLAADVFVNLDEDLLVGEAADARFGDGHFEIFGDRLDQRQVRIARHQFHGGRLRV